MTRSNALITIAVVTLLAGGLAWALGAYGVIFAGAAGLFAAFGVYFTEPERELSRQSYTLRPLDDPTLASQYEMPVGSDRERPWLWKSLVVAYAFALIVLGFALAASEAPAKEYSERFESVRCWFVLEDARPTRCGLLIVPERRDQSNGRELMLPVVILKRSTADSGRPPIIYLSGGPGSPSYLDEGYQVDFWWEIAESLPPGHDFVLFDQRGTGSSDPWLGCPEVADPKVWAGLTEAPSAEKDSLKVWREGVVACRDRLLEEGADLGAYNSRESARDVAALGRYLGLPNGRKVTLYGVSYGTQLALTVMRDHSEVVHSAILDSVSPLQANGIRDAPAYLDGALSAVFSDCSANSDCARAYPDLEKSLEHAIDTLHDNPIAMELNQSTHFPSIEIDRPLYATIDDAVLLDILHWILYDPANIPHLPLLVHGLGKGEFWRLKFYAEGYFFDPDLVDLADGMEFSVDCHDEFSFESPETIETVVRRYPLYGNWARLGWDYNVCGIWPSGRAEPIENSPVHSDIPTLLLAGAYDPVTPPKLARAAAATLSNSHIFTFPSESHGISFTHPCAKEVMKRFLDDPHVRPAPKCLASLRPRDFLALGSVR